jgi:MtN3 and saliva related transmembrane protein
MILISEDMFFYIGLLAGALTSISFVPQAWRIWKTRSAKDLSLPMFLIFSAGVVLWLTYGLLSKDIPIILTNVITLALCLSIIFMKWKFR